MHSLVLTSMLIGKFPVSVIMYDYIVIKALLQELRIGVATETQRLEQDYKRSHLKKIKIKIYRVLFYFSYSFETIFLTKKIKKKFW